MVHLKTNVAEYAILLDEDNKQFLLVQWGEEHGQTWHFPGGRLEEEDSEIQGLRREVMEEIGVEIEVLRPVFSKFATKADCPWIKTGGERYALFYLAKIKPGQGIQLDYKEHHVYRWFKREDIDNIDFFMSFYKDMLDKVLPF